MTRPCLPLNRVLGRFRVEPSTGCWLWLGWRDRAGYGFVMSGGRALRVHRVAWELLVGPIPPGKILRHHCDEPACLRPDHCEPGTNADNVADMVARGRQARGERNGHARLTEAEVRWIRSISPRGPEVIRTAWTFQIAPSTVRAILSGQRWGWLPDKPESTYVA